MILIPLALLPAGPVHEEPVRPVDERDRPQHDDADARRAEPRQKTREQAQAAEELADSDQHGDDPRESHLLREKPQRPLEPEPPEPAQQLLRAVRKHHQSQRDAQDQPGPTVIGLKECLHGFSSWIPTFGVTCPRSVYRPRFQCVAVYRRQATARKLGYLFVSK